MRLAYQELSEQQKKKEEQFRTLDPKRAEQVERLGKSTNGSMRRELPKDGVSGLQLCSRCFLVDS